MGMAAAVQYGLYGIMYSTAVAYESRAHSRDTNQSLEPVTGTKHMTRARRSGRCRNGPDLVAPGAACLLSEALRARHPCWLLILGAMRAPHVSATYTHVTTTPSLLWVNQILFVAIISTIILFMES